MGIDLTSLNAGDLDELIAEAIRRRAVLEPIVPPQRPEKAEAIVNPAWFVFAVKEGTIIQIRHPGAGWQAYLVPPIERAHLTSILTHHSLLAGVAQLESAQSSAPQVVQGGGGKLH